MNGMAFTLIIVLVINVLNFAYATTEDDNKGRLIFNSLLSCIILLGCIGVLIFES